MSVVQPRTLPQRLVHKMLNIDPENDILNAASDLVELKPDLSTRLMETVKAIKSAYYANETLDYAALKASPEYRILLQLTAELRVFDPLTIEGAVGQRALWINLYNLLILHAVIAYDVQGSPRDVKGFFSKAAYVINGLRFSANDIEHGVLRANDGYPYVPTPQFRAGDARLRYVLELDARIHFALNCASASCPPIAVYTADQLDSQLDMAARAFINGGGIEVDVARGVVRLSKIFQWYRNDFSTDKGHAPLLAMIAGYLVDEEPRTVLQERASSLRVKFMAYDWSLNSGAAGD